MFNKKKISLLNNEMDSIKSELRREKMKSAFWKSKAMGKEPALVGSKEDMDYLLN